MMQIETFNMQRFGTETTQISIQERTIKLLNPFSMNSSFGAFKLETGNAHLLDP
jgi:hypothetical protein